MLSSRLLILAAAAAASACALAPPAPAAARTCAPGSYSYAGILGTVAGSGVGARIEPLRASSVAHGHVAAWVGVGGYGLGPNGTDEWLQAGIVQRAGQPPALYYELTLPHRDPRYVALRNGVPPLRGYRMAVLETQRHPGWWRVWVDGAPATRRFHLPGSHGAWKPVVTAESWNDSDTTACNGFAFRFSDVVAAARAGGAWGRLEGSVIEEGGPTAVLRRGTLLAYGAA